MHTMFLQEFCKGNADSWLPCEDLNQRDAFVTVARRNNTHSYLEWRSVHNPISLRELSLWNLPSEWTRTNLFELTQEQSGKLFEERRIQNA